MDPEQQKMIFKKWKVNGLIFPDFKILNQDRPELA